MTTSLAVADTTTVQGSGTSGAWQAKAWRRHGPR